MAPKFDPSQPFETDGPRFDPNQPFEQEDAQPSGPSTTRTEALAGHAADNIPFMRQLAAAFGAAKMKAAGSPMDFGENYKQLLLAEQRQLDQSKLEHAGLSRLGSGAGFTGTALALPISGLAGLAGFGAVQGLSDASANPANSLADILMHTAVTTAATPLLGKAAEKIAVPLVAPLARLGGRGLEAGADAVRNLAGWLKVNSIHPTPALAEDMASLAGGKAAVGRELLSRGLGGLTKGSTARQIGAALDEAGANIGALAQAHDAAGKAAVDIAPALDVGLGKAQELLSSNIPEEQAAGRRLMQLVQNHIEDFAGANDAPVSAMDALAIKRKLAKSAYGSGAQLRQAADQIAGDYGRGTSEVERAVDSAMDDTIGPGFSSANLAFRRLLGASEAADRQAGRASSNHLLGMLPTLAGGSEIAAGHGAGKAGMAALAMALANRYGSQVAARSLYSPVAGSMSALGSLLSATPEALPVMSGETLGDILRGLRRRPLVEATGAAR